MNRFIEVNSYRGEPITVNTICIAMITPINDGEEPHSQSAIESAIHLNSGTVVYSEYAYDHLLELINV